MSFFWRRLQMVVRTVVTTVPYTPYMKLIQNYRNITSDERLAVIRLYRSPYHPKVAVRYRSVLFRTVQVGKTVW